MVPILSPRRGEGRRDRFRRVEPTPLPPGLRDWFLTEEERANPATGVRLWTDGNSARPLVDGRTYFAALADAVEATGPGDLVLLAGWRADADERARDDGPTLSGLLADAARRGVVVKGLLWRSHPGHTRFSGRQNRGFAEVVNAAGGEVLLDQRVRRFGSQHQKFVVVRHPDRPEDDVAFVGGIDLAHGRRDDSDHRGDPQPLPFSRFYDGTPLWHDVQVELRGPVVRDVEEVFRERWEDPAPLARLPWHVLADVVRGLDRHADPLPPPLPEPPVSGTCSVQLLRTYPHRHPGYPYAPDGERTAALGYAKALRRARRLVYVEDQYLWSDSVAAVFADALRREPELHLVAVVPRFPDDHGALSAPTMRHGHSLALETVHDVGGDRVQVLDLENHDGKPVYVHAKICIVDDVWATVGSDNFNRRSWTHDSELTAAIVDEERHPGHPSDPGRLGDGARAFARELRLRLWSEHLDLDDVDALLNPLEAVEVLRASARTLDAWYEGGCVGPRPSGRLRPHAMSHPPRWQRLLAAPGYRAVVDPDGRSPREKLLGLT